VGGPISGEGGRESRSWPFSSQEMVECVDSNQTWDIVGKGSSAILVRPYVID
jgi:hypothetical protein